MLSGTAFMVYLSIMLFLAWLAKDNFLPSDSTIRRLILLSHSTSFTNICILLSNSVFCRTTVGHPLFFNFHQSINYTFYGVELSVLSVCFLLIIIHTIITCIVFYDNEYKIRDSDTKHLKTNPLNIKTGESFRKFVFFTIFDLYFKVVVLDLVFVILIFQ